MGNASARHGISETGYSAAAKCGGVSVGLHSHNCLRGDLLRKGVGVKIDNHEASSNSFF
jgi:hypothetical protein